MDFNSNDEYLKAFPPNFGPKIERPNKERLHDLESHGLPPKDPQILVTMENDEANPAEVPETVCLDDDLRCKEVQEPIQIDAAKAENYNDVLLEEQQEILFLGEDLAPVLDEPMPQMVDMALLRDEEMVVDDDDGGAFETMLSLEAIEESVIDAEPRSDVEVNGPHSAIESIEERRKDAEAIRYVETQEPDTSNEDFITSHSEVEQSVIVERITEEAAMEDELFEPPNLKEFVKSTKVFTEFEKPVTDVDWVEGNAMDTEALNVVEYDQPTIEIQVMESSFITAENPDQIQVVESALKTLEESSENANAFRQIEIKEPVTLKVTEKTTIKAIPLTETKEKADLEVGTEEPTRALEIIEKTTIKAKAICEDEEEEPRFRVKFSESTSASLIRFDEALGTCSEDDVEKIVDSIMNDIAGIEANMADAEKDGGLEAAIESNTNHQKVTPIYEKPIGVECEDLTCQEHVSPS